jgi:hypothetical protein
MTRTKAWQSDRPLTQPEVPQFSRPMRLPPAIVPLSVFLLALALIGPTTTMMGVFAANSG